MIKLLKVLLIIVVLLVLAGAMYQSHSTKRDLQNFPAPGELFDVGGHRLHMVCQGSGSPTVVLQAGWGNDVNHWSEVLPAVSEFTRVCAYDRAGLGWSEEGAMPPSGAQVVTDLARLLETSGEAPPYIMAGHSLGGPFVRLYEAKYPENVVGLVLVDPTPENPPDCPPLPLRTRFFYNVMVSLAPLGVPRLALPTMVPLDNSALKPEGRKAHGALRAISRNPRTVWAEFNQFCDIREAVREAPLPSAPTIVLVVKKEGDFAEPQLKMADRIQAQELIVTDQSGHWIQLDQPQLVIDAIRKLAERETP